MAENSNQGGRIRGNKSGGGKSNKNRNKNRKRNRGRKKPNSGNVLAPDKPTGPMPADVYTIEEPQNYAVLFFESLDKAKTDLEKIKTKRAEVDRLNVVIRHEANMTDPEITAIEGVKLFAGAAWALIHDRRVEDGWYNTPQ